VIHLFGPNSVASHFLSPGPAAAPAATAAGGAPASSTPGSPAPSAAASTEPSATWGDVAHQMFVTGNPAQEGAAALPKGRNGGM
jgi:hypothetical protein